MTRNKYTKEEDRPKRDALTDTEIEKLRLAAADESETAVIETLLSTGCRISELVTVRKDEIDGGKVLVHNGKTSKDRYCYLNTRAAASIDTYRKLRRDSNPYLFPEAEKGTVPFPRWWMDRDNVTFCTHIGTASMEDTIRRLAKRAGVERMTPHEFRRTFTATAFRRGMPEEYLARMLGHKPAGAAQMRPVPTEEELEQAYRKYME